MFWADSIAEMNKQRYREKILTGVPLVIRDEKTCSGRVHVGSLRGVAIHGILHDILSQRDTKSQFLFEINDFDPMDDCPPQLEATHKQYMGKPLCMVPAPDGSAKNFAEFYAEEFMNVIQKLGFDAEFYRLSDIYRSGKMNEMISTALLHSDRIREIYREISGSEKPDDWLPISVVCPKCGNIGSTKASDFDGKTVAYECGDFVKWAKGCGDSGRTSPFDGNAKFVWKVDWAAKWKVMGVDVEGAGKDHSTKGGSRDVSKAISQQIFDYPNPFDIPYEFFNIGGLKMSSSKGRGATAKEISDLLPPKITRLLFLRKDPKKPIDFEPEGETIPCLFDEYDRLAEAFFSGDAKRADFARIFELSHLESERKSLEQMFLPRFRDVAFLTQIPHIDFFAKLEQAKGSPLTAAEKAEAELRAEYAKKWLTAYAPEKYIFQIQNTLPECGKNLNEMEKKVLSGILLFFENTPEPDGEAVHGALHDLKRELEIDPKLIFSPLYRIFLGRESGPKAGWLLSVLGGDFVQKRLKEALAV
jgi:lysyl-tRNA synthetase class 1